MAERIELPLLTGFRITGFQPIYSANIELRMAEGPYVVLGGNGLGKTTLMQAVVYGLAGGLDDKTEDVKALRWSNGYFRGRLNPTQLAEAHIEVDFKLGQHSISVRRGFKGPDVIAVRAGRSGWVEENAPERFAELLREYGGYLDAHDFAFIVHRLLYLPESRRLIAWDTDAQIRLLMLLNQDIALERKFREDRARLRLLDSKKRHIHVALGKAEQELASLMEYDEHQEDDDEEQPEKDEADEGQAEKRLPILVDQLNAVGRRRVTEEKRVRTAMSDLSRVSGHIDRVREEIESAEAGLVANFLAETEREQNLALAKLVENAICPACGQNNEKLAEQARKHLHSHHCLLCGSDESQGSNPKLAALRDQLATLLRQQQAFEEVVRLARVESDKLREEELDLQTQVNEIRYSRSVVAMVERPLPEFTIENLKKLKKELEDEEADAEAQMNAIREKLVASYDKFRKQMDARMEKLRTAYAGYATAFLGLPCELEEVPRTGLLELKLFVPKFDDVVRDVQESCSEAQRFFLDIAFRMALIDAACGERGTGTFICETPETALDVSYIQNVVQMFSAFAKKRHNILLTANIQNFGIAEKLLARSEKRDRAPRIVDLLKLGRLSAVQQSARNEFKKIMRRMLTTKTVKK